MDDIEPNEGDFFEGVLLETCKDDGISRPRVRPAEELPQWMRVEFPRSLREQSALGTRFRADVHVRQKHNGDGSAKGPLYLRAENNSIIKVSEPRGSGIRAEKRKDNNSSGKAYVYVPINPSQEATVTKFQELRTVLSGAQELTIRTATATVTKYDRSQLVAKYALLRSSGNCEGCQSPAPFIRRNGQFYLEVHHIRGVADGGKDHPINVAAVCPNCHSRITHGRDGATYNEEIKRRILNLEASLDKEMGVTHP